MPTLCSFALALSILHSRSITYIYIHSTSDTAIICTWLFFFFLIPLEPCAFYFARNLLLCDSEWRFALDSDTIDETVSFCSSTRYQEKFKLFQLENYFFQVTANFLMKYAFYGLKKSSFDFFIFWYGKKHNIFIPKCVYVYYSTREKTTTVYYPDYRQNDHLICFYFPTFGWLRCVQTVKWDWEFIYGCFFPPGLSMCAVIQRLFKIRSNDEFELSSMNKSIRNLLPPTFVVKIK